MGLSWHIHCLLVWKVSGLNTAASTSHAPTGKHIAVAFRGAYHRLSGRNGHRRWSNQDNLDHDHYCSDYFQDADNIDRAIIAPLREAGNNVSIYFHTYSSLDDPTLDEKLVTNLGPRRHTISNTTLPKIVDSFIEVLDLVGKDDDIDYIVLLRFDVRYKRRITELNIDWDKSNFAFREFDCGKLFPAVAGQYRKASDLFYVLPILHRLSMIQALRMSSYLSPATRGPGHWAWDPLAKLLGYSNMSMISSYCGSSKTTYSGDLLPQNDFEGPFLGIDPACDTGNLSSSNSPNNQSAHATPVI